MVSWQELVASVEKLRIYKSNASRRLLRSFCKSQSVKTGRPIVRWVKPFRISSILYTKWNSHSRYRCQRKRSKCALVELSFLKSCLSVRFVSHWIIFKFKNTFWSYANLPVDGSSIGFGLPALREAWKTDTSTSSVQDTSTSSVQVTEDRRKQRFSVFMFSRLFEKATGKIPYIHNSYCDIRFLAIEVQIYLPWTVDCGRLSAAWYSILTYWQSSG